MEKNLQQMQFKDRLCRTLLRINWLIAIVAMLPVLSKIFIGVAAFGMAFYYLILIAVTIITLGLFLLNDSFRALYNVDLNGLQQLSDQIVQVYRIAQPVLAGICAFLSAIVLIVIIRNQDEAHKTRKIVSVSLSVLIVLIATLGKKTAESSLMPLFYRMGKLFCGSSVNPNFPIRIGGFILHSSGLSEYWACLLPDIPALIMRWIAMSFWTAGKRRIFGFGLTTLSTKSQVFP